MININNNVINNLNKGKSKKNKKEWNYKDKNMKN